MLVTIFIACSLTIASFILPLPFLFTPPLGQRCVTIAKTGYLNSTLPVILGHNCHPLLAFGFSLVIYYNCYLCPGLNLHPCLFFLLCFPLGFLSFGMGVGVRSIF